MTTIPELQDRWVAAERNGDARALDELLAEDFRAVGPVGFVLDKQQWLDRYRTGDLRYESLELDEVDLRTHGDMAVAVGRWAQQGAIGDRRVDGEFRVTQILLRDGDRWTLDGIHLSPISPPNQGRAES